MAKAQDTILKRCKSEQHISSEIHVLERKIELAYKQGHYQKAEKLEAKMGKMLKLRRV